MSASLEVPPGAKSDKQATELIRAWAAHGGLQCSLNINAWSGEQTTIGWGILLSDIARHLSNALYESRQLDRMRTLSEMTSAQPPRRTKATTISMARFVASGRPSSEPSPFCILCETFCCGAAPTQVRCKGQRGRLPAPPLAMLTCLLPGNLRPSSAHSEAFHSLRPIS